MKQIFTIIYATIAICLTSCEKDLCNGVVCNNNGHCEEGDCICPIGFEGEDCSTLISPSSITITRVDLLSFPEEPYNDGEQWDNNGTGPDISFHLFDCDQPIWFSTDDFYPDAVNGQVYSFNFQAEIQLVENDLFTSNENPNNSALVCFNFNDNDTPEDSDTGLSGSHAMGGGYPTYIYWDNPEWQDNDSTDGIVSWSGQFPEYISYHYDGGMFPFLAFELLFFIEYSFE